MNEHADDPADPVDALLPARPADFDDSLYLMLNQDVAPAVASGVFTSGFEHYARYGAKEGRRYRPDAQDSETALVVTVGPAAGPRRAAPEGGVPPMPAHRIESLRMSSGGSLLLTGWLDDATDPLIELMAEGDGWTSDLAGTALARERRRDVAEALHSGERHAHGFWAFAELGENLPRQTTCRLRFGLRSGAAVTLDVLVQPAADAAVRDAALIHLADADFHGSPQHAAIASLDGGVGAQQAAASRRISRALTVNPYVERFGPALAQPKASIVVCLYGKPEYLFLQNSLFAGGAGIGDYEFIYVCNSPELGEQVLRDARIGSLVHGIRQTVVLLSGNAGFGAANNLGASYASSGRVIAVNPDVAPLHTDWAQRHTAVVETLPQAQTSLFGVPLYYADGSLMHGGMYFENDAVPVTGPAGFIRQNLLRVEHYGKGAPPEAARFTRPRPVPAITGAFMSLRRDWFERLGGFAEDYGLGHYEDADLCLRSLALGTAPWLHDIRLYHLEGRGSARLHVHDGGTLVNRWLFSRNWGETVRTSLLGPSPAHPLLQGPEAAAPVAPRGRSKAR